MAEVHTTAADQTYELVDVDALHEHPDNPRRGDVEAIVASIVANGWHGALTVQRSTSYVLAGNHRLRAARQLGMAQVPVLWRDVDDTTAQALLIADNRASDFGYFDEEVLVPLLLDQDPDTLSGMLFSQADLAMLTEATAPSLADGLTAHGDDPAHPEVRVNQALSGQTDGYLQAQTRSVVLPYPLEEYVGVTENLRRLRIARSLPTNAALVAALAAEAAEGVDA